MTVRCATDKTKGKGAPAVSFSGKGKGKWRKPSSAKQLQDKLAARKAKSTCDACGQRGHWAGDPGCCGTRDAKFVTWPDEHVLPDREEFRTTMMVERIGQFDPATFGHDLCDHSVCTTSVTKLQSPDDAPTHDVATDTRNRVPANTDTVPSVVSAESRKFGRSAGFPVLANESRKCGRPVMESAGESEPKSDLGLGIIETPCLFCVRLVDELQRFAGGCWSEAMVARCVTHLCGQCADYLYVHKCVVRVGVLCLHPRWLSGSLSPGQPKLVLPLRKNHE